MPSPDRNRQGLDPDPFWYKSGVIYEVHVRAFYDSDADGIGDFRGLTQKLDYIKDLGVTAIWLLAVLSVAAQGRRLRHLRLLRGASKVRHAGGLQNVFARGAPPGAAGHHRTGAQPHFRPASVVSARPAGQGPAAAGAIFMSGATPPRNTTTPASSSRTSSTPTGTGTVWPMPIIGIGSSPISPT